MVKQIKFFKEYMILICVYIIFSKWGALALGPHTIGSMAKRVIRHEGKDHLMTER